MVYRILYICLLWWCIEYCIFVCCDGVQNIVYLFAVMVYRILYISLLWWCIEYPILKIFPKNLFPHIALHDDGEHIPPKYHWLYSTTNLQKVKEGILTVSSVRIPKFSLPFIVSFLNIWTIDVNFFVTSLLKFIFLNKKCIF